MTTRCDVLVAGGGVHGVGVAQAAAAAGHSVILLEKQAVAGGTSSRSSKLIHGGLRYLEKGSVRLVRECLRERQIMLDIAPDLVRLEHFYIPVYQNSRRYQWQLIAGLSMYAALAGFGAGADFRRLRPALAGPLDGLLQQGLKAVFRYQDARTDDRELTRAVMASAMELGATLLVPAALTSAEISADRVSARCRTDAGESEIVCKVLVNAAGPWAASLLENIRPVQPRINIDLVQGAHVVFRDWAVRHCHYLESPRDGRGIFVLPWRDAALVGTTETRFHGDPATVRARPAEKRYLLSTLRHYFPDTAPQDLANTAAFAGLRVLPTGDGHAFHRSRETRLETDQTDRPRVLSIFGGKLTAWRATAEKVMHRIAPSLPDRKAKADTRRLRLNPVDEVWPGG
ncbi:MAG: FAD-dependent oxidoreductase [Gammaproteobacteria bacterium]